jgi:general secretion pathway protein N
MPVMRIALTGMLLIGRADALVAIPPLAPLPEADVDRGAGKISPRDSMPSNPVPVERAQIGNPLWAIPLKQLSVTRERPIFSPSRRPPPPAVVNAPYVAPVAARPPKPAEPERPQLSLVGTVASEREGIGVFVDHTTKNVVRLRTGEAHQGWILRSVEGREATLEKDRETAVLALPPPGSKEIGSITQPPASRENRRRGR